MNLIILQGRLTADPTTRTTKTGMPVCNFSIAVDRPGTSRDNRITDFFDCVAWGGKDGPGRAGVIQQYFHKGDGIIVSGELHNRKWVDNSGNQRTSVEVLVNSFDFPMGKKGQAAAPDETAPAPEAPAISPAAMAAVDEADLPF